MIEELATQIASAINMRALYPVQHPRVVQAIENIIQTMIATRSDAITYLIVDDDLVVGDNVMRKTSLSVRQFIEVLKQHGIER
ncbi:MAG TPA: hypothetical protein VJ853_08440, partial [Thermoanaerobaculia bacterium]|nr:hypothetical protein [Thermoanaerobaculia bacterium]